MRLILLAAIIAISCTAEQREYVRELETSTSGCKPDYDRIDRCKVEHFGDPNSFQECLSPTRISCWRGYLVYEQHEEQ